MQNYLMKLFNGCEMCIKRKVRVETHTFYFILIQ